MTAEFLVFTTSHFDRELKKLVAYHPELPEHYRGHCGCPEGRSLKRKPPVSHQETPRRAGRWRPIPYPVRPLSIPVRHRGPVCISEGLLIAARRYLLISRHRARRPAHSGDRK